jgi:hypothetical protein
MFERCFLECEANLTGQKKRNKAKSIQQNNKRELKYQERKTDRKKNPFYQSLARNLIARKSGFPFLIVFLVMNLIELAWKCA